MRKLLTVVIVSVLSLIVVGCSSDSDGKGSVYYLNFKPEIAEQIEELAEKYTEEEGVEVKVVTAAQGTDESTVSAEIPKNEPPTIFLLNGPVRYGNWAEYR